MIDLSDYDLVYDFGTTLVARTIQRITSIVIGDIDSWFDLKDFMISVLLC